jgi:small subunit ribosomal protein S9
VENQTVVEPKIIAGRRKNGIARVKMVPGTGEITVNGRTFREYFSRETLRMMILEPLKVTNSVNKYDIIAIVNGGGVSGQAGALRHAIARALLRMDEGNKQVLRRSGFLTRDSRMKERKKYGQRGARARFQWTKR